MRIKAWSREELIALARRKVLEAIADGYGDYAKIMTRELMRLCDPQDEAR